MRYAYYIKRADNSVELLSIEREPLHFKDAVRLAIMNEVNTVYAFLAMKTQIEADKLQSNKLFELDGTHDLMDDVSFVKDDYVGGNYMVCKHECAAVWKIPDFIKDLFQKDMIRDVKIHEDGVTITATCKNGRIKPFDFTRQQQWWNMQFQRQVCENFDQYSEIHTWILAIMMQTI